MNIVSYLESRTFECGYASPQVIVVSYKPEGILCDSPAKGEIEDPEDGGIFVM